jgi:hypothetical protein
MSVATKIYEKKLHEVWNHQSFNSPLKTVNGDDIKILEAGILNDDTAGPDFLGARIRIGNLVYVGDIEIDKDYNDWKNHGHNIDNKHNKVVLHASLTNLNNQQYVYTKDGRRVPTVCLANFIDDKNLTEAAEKFVPQTNNNTQIKCAHLTAEIDFHIKKSFVSELGIERFKKKCAKIENRLKELLFIKEMNLREPVIGFDLRPEFQKKDFHNIDFRPIELWQQLFYELVFEALGYSKNKTIMQRLAMSVNIQFLQKLGHDSETLSRFESALFNVSGLIPTKESLGEKIIPEYLTALNNDWEILKRIYDGHIYNKADWNFFKLRPQNFPTIRIAAGVRFLEALLFNDLLGVISKKFHEIRNFNVLVNSIRSLFVLKAKGFWKNHYVFDQPSKDEIKYFVGASRADEIVVNVVLPFYYIYYSLFDEEEMSKKILKIYTTYDQRADNKIVREVSEALHANAFLKKTLLNQGMLELFRNYCSKRKCLECRIGKMIFN